MDKNYIQIENIAMKWLFDDLPVGIFIIDSDCRILCENKAAFSYAREYVSDAENDAANTNKEEIFVQRILKGLHGIRGGKCVFRLNDKKICNTGMVPYITISPENGTYLLLYLTYIDEMVSSGNSALTERRYGKERSQFRLTARELQVLALMHEGLNNEEISKKLSISLSTVKSHNENIFRKLNVNNRQKALLAYYGAS